MWGQDFFFRNISYIIWKGLVHDNAHVWVLKVADCFLTQSEAS